MGTYSELEIELGEVEEKLGTSPSWFHSAHDADDFNVFEKLYSKAAEDGLTTESMVTVAEAAKYTGIDEGTLKLLIHLGALEQEGINDTIVYSDLLDLMDKRYDAKQAIKG